MTKLRQYQPTASYKSLLASLSILMIATATLVDTAPAIVPSEQPTEPTLPRPDEVEGVLPQLKHHYVSELLRCLTARDNGDQRLSDNGCIPQVFTKPENVPSAEVSNTILSFLANTSIQGERNMTITLEIAEDQFLDQLNQVHLRIHKRKTDPSVLKQLSSHENCDLSNGLEITLSILSLDHQHFLIHKSVLGYQDLLTEEWLDFTSFIDVYNATIHSGNKTTLHMEFDVKDECWPQLTLEDIGITAENSKEPVLVIYAKQKDNADDLEREVEASLKNAKRKRQIEGGSGVLQQDLNSCRLIKHSVSYSHIRANLLGVGHKFNLNYCTGMCTTASSLHVMNFHSLTLAKADPSSPLPSPCCVPTKYIDLTVPVQVTETQFSIRTFQNITAKKCGCR